MQNSHNETKNSPRMTGALLAGGSSRRMGEDKTLITVAGQPLWQHCRAALAAVCEDVLIAGDRPDLALPGIPCYVDTYPGSALAGLHTALLHAETDWVTVLPCDLPFPSSELLRRLQTACHSGLDAVVPRTRLGREPLIACYHKKALQPITRRLTSGQPKILDLLDELNVHYLDETDLPTGWRRSLLNINSPADLDKIQQSSPALTFIARSGTGKTTLLEKLIAEMTAKGWRVGALKHDAHKFEIDHEGKDSWRLTQAGAAVTAISSPTTTAVIRQHEYQPQLAGLLQPFQGEVDLVLTEGFKQSSLPKIEVHRAELNQPLLSRGEQHDPTLIAVASNAQLEVDVPLFDLNEVTALADFIEERFLL